VFPEPDVPVLRTISPLLPALLESAVISRRLPLLLPAELAPLMMVMVPPLATEEEIPPLR
jgi:hypothetical protein